MERIFFHLFNVEGKVFVYDAEGSRVATIKENRWSVNCDYEILDTADEMSIDGKFFSLHSRIMKNWQAVATILREFTLVRDAFTLEAEEKDIPFFTALVIALDNMCDKKQKQINRISFKLWGPPRVVLFVWTN